MNRNSLNTRLWPGLERLLGWCLFLGLGISAIAASILIYDLGYLSYMKALVIYDSGNNGYINLLFFLVSLAIALALYILNGFNSGHWKLSVIPMAFFLCATLALLTLGFGGLFLLLLAGLLPDQLASRGRQQHSRNPD